MESSILRVLRWTAGDLYVVAPNAGSVYRLAAGTYAVSTVYNDPGNEYTSVVLDRFGNLCMAPAAESGQETGNIFEITRNTASVAFPTTVANSTSATSHPARHHALSADRQWHALKT